ncbi:MAG: HemK/PrmC family methyltransferase [Candidatus Andersenbacteria bacterium]
MTIREALQQGYQTLATASDAPTIDTERLLLHSLSMSESSWLFSHSDESLPQAIQQTFNDMLQQRVVGKPLAYILGRWEFYGREFIVNENVLIPRPATEVLVDQARATIQTLYERRQRPLVVADIGTGSGCIAVTLACELPPEILERIYATDTSDAALAVAAINAHQHRVTERITFLSGDMLQPLTDKNIDLIVSNPPYLPTAELQKSRQSNDPEKVGLYFEPHGALDGGRDGQKYTSVLHTLPVPTIYETSGGTIIYQ